MLRIDFSIAVLTIFFYICNENTNKLHVNGSKLHLNKNGVKILTKIFVNSMNKC